MERNNKNIITISREFGSGGRLVGQKLAEEMGIPYYDRQILDRTAEKEGFSRQMIEEAEAKAKNGFFYRMASAFGTTSMSSQYLPVNEKFFLAQFDMIREIAGEGPCVIVGRCADYVLKDIPGVTNIFIFSDFEKRKVRAISKYGLPIEDADRVIQGNDKARKNYYEYHTGRKWGNAGNYNMSIDSGYMETDNIAKLIVKYLEMRD